ncbi:MAG: SET domain-containing protein-lysine N-methyltransferase [Candidatus Obscuribacterales bacterium]|nr:SET domain-containing protein-lysine N-methyltransferase [Candidatus Obscuribacterales bacterium]
MPKAETGLLPSIKSTEKIQVKNSRGVIQCISAHAFQKLFGVAYTSRLLIDKNCPSSVLNPFEFVLRKVPSEARRAYFEEQLVNLKDQDPLAGAAMKEWLYGEQLRRAYIANIYIAKINDSVGYGAFAGENLRPGQMLGEYTGLARAWKTSDCSNTYIFNYVQNAVIDACKRGNITRFINHSEHAANARYMRVMLEGIEHVILLAQKHISKDEQILFNYGSDYWKNRNLPQELSCKS